MSSCPFKKLVYSINDRLKYLVHLNVEIYWYNSLDWILLWSQRLGKNIQIFLWAIVFHDRRFTYRKVYDKQKNSHCAIWPIKSIQFNPIFLCSQTSKKTHWDSTHVHCTYSTDAIVVYCTILLFFLLLPLLHLKTDQLVRTDRPSTLKFPRERTIGNVHGCGIILGSIGPLGGRGLGSWNSFSQRKSNYVSRHSAVKRGSSPRQRSLYNTVSLLFFGALCVHPPWSFAPSSRVPCTP